jgi:hypothetical protein
MPMLFVDPPAPFADDGAWLRFEAEVVKIRSTVSAEDASALNLLVARARQQRSDAFDDTP